MRSVLLHLVMVPLYMCPPDPSATFQTDAQPRSQRASRDAWSVGISASCSLLAWADLLAEFTLAAGGADNYDISLVDGTCRQSV